MAYGDATRRAYCGVCEQKAGQCARMTTPGMEQVRPQEGGGRSASGTRQPRLERRSKRSAIRGHTTRISVSLHSATALSKYPGERILSTNVVSENHPYGRWMTCWRS